MRLRAAGLILLALATIAVNVLCCWPVVSAVLGLPR